MLFYVALFQVTLLFCFVRSSNYIRPLFEYNCVTWWFTLKKDIVAIEKFQKRFTKRFVGLRSAAS